MADPARAAATDAALDPAAREELRQIARDCHGRGDLAEALDIQRKVLASGPPAVADTLFLALLLFAARDLPAAIGALNDGIAHFPDDPSLHENLAVCLVTSGRLTASVAACREALRLGSTSPNVHDCLCDALSRLGQIDAAIRPAARRWRRRTGVSAAAPRWSRCRPAHRRRSIPTIRPRT